jgi:hypothetical protein
MAVCGLVAQSKVVAKHLMSRTKVDDLSVFDCMHHSSS